MKFILALTARETESFDILLVPTNTVHTVFAPTEERNFRYLSPSMVRVLELMPPTQLAAFLRPSHHYLNLPLVSQIYSAGSHLSRRLAMRTSSSQTCLPREAAIRASTRTQLLMETSKPMKRFRQTAKGTSASVGIESERILVVILPKPP